MFVVLSFFNHKRIFFLSKEKAQKLMLLNCNKNSKIACDLNLFNFSRQKYVNFF